MQLKKPPRDIEKLPSLIGSSSSKLQDELRFLIEIFEEMEKERQNSGLIPISDEGEEN
jgi:ssDNA-specific exonuclease RecJ